MKRFLQCCVYSLNVMIFFREKYNNEKVRKILSIILVPMGLCRYIWTSFWNNFFEKEKNKSAVVMIIKNEGKYLNEFLEYYTLLGCDIIIFDNESNDNTKEIVENYGNVKYIFWPGPKRQTDAYNYACKQFRDEYKYLLFFDADEYLVCDKVLEGKELKEILDKYFERDKRISGIGVNWLIFGSSGLIDDPKNGVIDSFTKCANEEFEWNQLIKSCVKPELVVGWVDAHLPLAIMGYKCVNLDGKVIDNPRNELPNDRSIRLYHYFVKNKKQYERKINKGRADNSVITMDGFYYYDRNECENKKAIEMKKYLQGSYIMVQLSRQKSEIFIMN